MLPHRIHNFWLAKWDGDEPTFAREVVDVFNIPGMPNVGFVGLGKQGVEFTATVTMFIGGGTVAANMLTAKRQSYLMHRLCSLQPITVMYRSINYFGTFAHLYKVVDVREAECRSMVRAMGDNGMNFSPATRLRLAVRMRPHAVL